MWKKVGRKFFVDAWLTNNGGNMFGRYGCHGLLHLLCLVYLLMPQEVNCINHSLAFFNATLGSHVNISGVLNFRSQFLFSFRTCSEGRLIHQSGPSDSDAFYEMRLIENGSLVVSWKSASIEVTDSVEVDDLSLMNNEWFTIESSFSLGQIQLQIEQGSVVRRSFVLANSTYRSYLWNLNLTGGGPLEVGGGGFTGCIQQGPQILLSSPSAVSVGVVWDLCPLEDYLGCGNAVMNPCWSYPCLNDGSCVYPGTGSNFSCQCRPMFSGSSCEVDLSSQGCQLNPCLNNGTCQSTNVTSRPYLCTCAAGFTGSNCGINKDECGSNPCQNRGRCIDGINNFSCICNGTGYAGALCQTNTDECQTALVTCQNGGTCMDTPGSYKCICPLGFTGSNCQNQSDDCLSNPCHNSGTCVRLLGAYRCNCSPGFTGTDCEVNIDDCVRVMCSGNHTRCVDGINSFTCRCLPGYHDANVSASDNVTSCEDIDECLSQPCANGSTCLNQANNYTCRCRPGFTGRQCQMDINECIPNPCQNGAGCDNLIGGYRCRCMAGFTDNNCSTNIDECQSRPCQNGATCIDLINQFNCTCLSGWTGDTCQQNIDECDSNPCQNGATCNDLVNHYTCTCPVGYTGRNCETNIDDCDESFCLNNGTCIDGVNWYTCNCTNDWMGSNCSLAYDPCVMNVCKNNGTCQSHPPSHNYTCQCQPGFTGHDCQQNINDCQNNSCQSFQVCVDGINSYSCACPPGMTGLTCETDIDECQSNPCLNGATCVDGKGNFSCQCIQEVVNLTAYSGNPRSIFRIGFDGMRCEHLIDACSYNRPSICLNNGFCDRSNDSAALGFTCSCRSLVGTYYTGRFCQQTTDPCRLAVPQACYSGGTCQTVGDKYICHCVPGYTGAQCQMEIDECESNPCHYNGTCRDAVNRYTCYCTPGTTGVNCETNIDECASRPCLNDGQCVDLINAYVCNCSGTGFEGVHCEADINECLSSPCQHNATCNNDRNMYRCSCYPGYNGANCQLDIDECLSSPCQYNSTCLQRSNSSRPDFSFATAAGFDCVCPLGITGVLCETDIDECASRPCIHGNCQDLINGYICRCRPGYRGIHCEQEINECVEYVPCQNGATCLDCVADYECLCAALANETTAFGGKNCSVELIGCRSNPCRNGATCRPFLENEAANVHDFSCHCPSGFSGKLCNVSTSVSFDLNSWLAFHPKNNVSDVLSVSLDFRTTLSDVTLLVFTSNQSGVDFRLELVGRASPRLQLSSSYLLNSFLLVDYPGVKTLNDANWHRIQLNFTSTNVSLHFPDCLRGVNCSVAATLRDQWSSAEGVLYIAGNKSNLIVGTFVGCMRDIQVNGGMFLPGVDLTQGVQQTVVSSEVGVGCQHHDQCNPDPCNGQGLCSDLWTKYRCVCRRPFWGENCTKRFGAATFGYNGIHSFAQFNFSADQRNRMENFLDVSFFFRTRKPSGVLFYVGTGTMDSSQVNATYFALQLNDGQLIATVKLTERDLTFRGVSSNVIDGQQHFVQLQRNESLLQLVVDSNSRDFAMNESRPLTASVVYVGGIPSVGGRKRRQSHVGPVVTYFEGTMEDVRLNDLQLQIFVTNETIASHPQIVTPCGLTDVKAGEVTSDICHIQQPCENNATCDNVFFNDFYCNCTAGFRGRNCSQLDFCFYNTCPPGGSCRNLNDGFECVSNATFNGISSVLRYSTTLNRLDIRDISADVRTRKRNGTILQLRPGYASSIFCFISLELSDGEVLLRFTQQQLEHQLRATNTNTSDVADGTVHTINVTFSGNEALLSVDDSLTKLNYSNAQTVASGCNSSTGYMEAFIGSPTTDLVGDSVESKFFKGCLSEVRVNGILLPFFGKSQLANNTAAQRFDLEETKDVLIGCAGDDVCGGQNNPCRNNAKCDDLWNAYSCHCTPGFTGRNCSENIDDCLNNECLNNASCVDGITSYTCACNQGFTGFRCETNIDECSSNPCLHNGTCVDLVNGYLCSCQAAYVGQRCQMPVSEDCRRFSCLNNATCETLPSGEEMWKCSCLAGYTGFRCETKMDLCANNTCSLNSSVCLPRPLTLNYSCNCFPGYTGRNCEDDIDECVVLEPCLNAGNCSNVPGTYVCICPSEWTGPRCDVSGQRQSGGLTPNEIGIIVGVIGGTVLLAAVIAIIVFLCIARKKRATHGTYSPSRQEMAGSRVDMRSALKLPPEERLI